MEVGRRRVDAAEARIEAASEAIELNLRGIRGAVLRPIEMQQAIAALQQARLDYLGAVTKYNASQFALLYAIGTLPHEGV